MFPALLSDPGKWAEVLDVDSDGHRMLEDYLSAREYFSESLRNFRGQVQGMLELYFEPLSQHSNEAYAQAYAAYFTDMTAAGGLFFPGQEFEQSFPAQICFVPWHIQRRQGGPFLRKRRSSAIFPIFFIPIFTVV